MTSFLLLFLSGFTTVAQYDRVPASYRNQEVKEIERVIEPTTQAPAPQEKSDDTQLTGDWNGVRSTLSDNGIDLALIYKSEIIRNFSGGLDQRTGYLENIDLRAAFDFEKSFGLKGLSGFVYGLANMGGDRGHSPTGYVGDAQGTSNIETPTDSFKLYQIWLQQEFMDGRFSLLAGLHDLNSEFYVTETSSLFFNSSFGIGKEMAQTGANGPSIFPTTSLAVRAHAYVTDEFTIQVAAFNAQAGDPAKPHGTNIRYSEDDGVLWISEFAYQTEAGEDRNSKYALGFWTYSKDFAHHDGTNPDGRSEGFYVLIDQVFNAKWAAFVRAGFASQGPRGIRHHPCGRWAGP